MKEQHSYIDYSIVICTYNPDERILKRCLHAVAELDLYNIKTEVILVDNNSAAPVAELSYIKEYAKKINNLQLIFVKEQGVQYARMAAINAAKGKHIVYFDYDNEPAPDYLQQLKKLNDEYPQVAAWGPGNIFVDFIDGIESKIEGYARIAFQERHTEKINFACDMEWQECYPVGTGLCTNADLLKEYSRLAAQGFFTLSGRKGNLLSSGEDTQMVLLCISKGYAAGMCPSLKIKHIIPAKRANIPYLQRLAYGTRLCYETCLVQVFPGKKKQLESKLMNEAKFKRQTIKKFIRAKFKSGPLRKMELINFIAAQAGIYMALDKKLPSLIQRVVKSLRLE